jgi:hypothetical protein
MIYVTWFNPKSRVSSIFRARWRLFDRETSRFGAVAQSCLLVCASVLAMLHGAGVQLSKAALIPLGVSVLACCAARIADVRDDEI